MKRWLVGIGFGAMGAVCVAACGAKEGGPPCPPPSPSPTGALPPPKIEEVEQLAREKGNHAQSADLRGELLDPMLYFTGNTLTDNGRIANPADGITGHRVSGEEVRLTLEEIPGGDECVPLSSLAPDSSLPLYRVRLNGVNLCHHALPPLVDASELSVCSGATLQEKIDKYNKLAGLAIAVRGYWDADGVYQEAADKITLSCFSGVVAKCAHWGYLPWAKHKDGRGAQTPLDHHHRACVYAARAASGLNGSTGTGTGKSHTCNNTKVDVYDHLSPTIQAPQGQFKNVESGWNGRGRVCMNRPRYSCEAYVPTPCDAEQWGEALIRVNSEPHTLGGAPGNCPALSENACDFE